MAEKTALEKLRILLPHWIEHNHGHRHEFGDWAAAARQENAPEIAALIERAVRSMTETDAALSEVLARLGGPLPGGHHHHHGHHD